MTNPIKALRIVPEAVAPKKCRDCRFFREAYQPFAVPVLVPALCTHQLAKSWSVLGDEVAAEAYEMRKHGACGEAAFLFAPKPTFWERIGF